MNINGLHDYSFFESLTGHTLKAMLMVNLSNSLSISISAILDYNSK
ncbi:MAG: hypothetical protein PQ968_03785 [Methanobacterium sp.]